MVRAKQFRQAARGAKRVAKFADELRDKLEKYRLDDQASALVDRVLRSVEELRRYQEQLVDRLLADAPTSRKQGG